MNVVITHLLTSAPDPQRGYCWASDTPIDELHRSLRDCTLVVFHDRWPTPAVTLSDELVSVEFVKVEPDVNPYWHRWRCTADWLDQHPEVERVWCVDATDVEMLNPPWEHMEPGTVYVGSEDKRFGDGSDTAHWLRHHCPSLTRWFDAHPDLQVLNVGTVGGPRGLVAELARLLDKYEQTLDDYEMGWFNLLVHTFEGPWETGLKVHTPFLTNTRTGPSWWRHK